MTDHRFVGREQELERLKEFLSRALLGHGQVLFVRGDPGAGKTALIREFARRCQSAKEDFVFASGNCNAQTGIGDPYLPFREVLSLLTGDVDGRLAQGTLNAENADRLRALVSRSVQILVEAGPDLVDVLVPGYKLLAVVGKAVVNKVGWGDELERLAKRGAQRPPAGAGMEQSRIFEQYTDFLLALAAQQPLMLVVDDLHWADEGSIALFFHLARRIENRPILLIGSYRPAEVALGRDDERHPLEPVLNELQRYLGDITIDLDEATRSRGRMFIDALLDSQPNRLDARFRRAMHERTSGQPLFTVELLLAMEQAGQVMRDSEGRWVEGPELDWSTISARVEGVIEERIGRLEEDQYELLSVASVEGMMFTAQVVAEVQELPERKVLQTLSNDLERRHQLVRQQENFRINDRMLSRYQFAHALFQQFLYDEMSQGERRLLHRAMLHVLERLYVGETDEIAVQLAHHCTMAGEEERAAAYRIEAGDRAARLYAYVEARLHYAAALDGLERQGESREIRIARIDTTIKWERVSFFAVDPRESLRRLALVESLAEDLVAAESENPEHRIRLARLRYWIGRSHAYLNELPEALDYYRRVLVVAQEVGDEELLAIPGGVIGRVLVNQGQFAAAGTMLRQVIAPLERAANWPEWAFAMGYLGISLSAQGAYQEGLPLVQRAIARAQRMRDPTLLAATYCMLGFAHVFGGDLPRMEEASHACIEAARQAQSQLYLYAGYGILAWAESRLGRHDAAARSMQLSHEEGQRMSGRLLLSDVFAAVRAEVALNAGLVEEGFRLAEQAVAEARSIQGPYGAGIALWVGALALSRRRPPDWEAAESWFHQSIQSLEAGGALIEVARVQAGWGRICLDRGLVDQARDYLGRAIVQFEKSAAHGDLQAARRALSAVDNQPVK